MSTDPGPARAALNPRWGLVLAAWSVYAMYYLGRVNFSVAVPELESDASFSASQLGAFAAGFFWLYSLGGVPAGRLADRVGVRWLVGGGMVGSGLMNLVFVATDSFEIALVAWSANGLFQAMGWSPLLGGIGRWVPEKDSGRILGAFGSCFVAGTAITFALGGVLVDRFGTDILFTGAAAVLIPVGLWWLAAVRDTVTVDVARTAGDGSIRRLLWLLPTGSAIGVAYVALIVWTPAYFVGVHGLTIGRSGLYSAALPGIAIVATIAAGRRFRRTEGERPAVVVAALLVATSVALAVVPFAPGLVAAFAAIAVVTALVNTASSLLLGLFPPMTAPMNVAFAAGIFALAFNIGGGAGAPAVGRLVGRGQWDQTFFLLAAVVGGGAIWTGGWYAASPDLSAQTPNPLGRTTND